MASNTSPGKTQHVGPALWEHAEPQPVVRFYLRRFEECSLALAERTQTQNSAARALVAPGPHEGVKQREVSLNGRIDSAFLNNPLHPKVHRLKRLRHFFSRFVPITEVLKVASEEPTASKV